MEEREERELTIVFAKEYKNFIQAFSKKTKEDYVLNVSKIVKDKFDTKFLIPNKVQSFLLNYEITKLLNKAINTKTKKYKRVIYLNSNLTDSSILNTMKIVEDEYSDYSFNYVVVTKEDEDVDSVTVSKFYIKKEL